MTEEAQPDATLADALAAPLSDSEKLKALALWFDTWDTDRVTAALILRETGNSHEVQDDLRRIAEHLPDPDHLLVPRAEWERLSRIEAAARRSHPPDELACDDGQVHRALATPQSEPQP